MILQKGRKYKTRNMKEAVVFLIQGEGTFQVIGAIKNLWDDRYKPQTWTMKGRAHEFINHEDDLVRPIRKTTRRKK